jgi:hypothetical protein
VLILKRKPENPCKTREVVETKKEVGWKKIAFGCFLNVNSRFVRQDTRKMLFPNPTDKVRGIVLVLSQPEFAFLTDNVENLRKQMSENHLVAKELARLSWPTSPGT